MFAKPFRRTLSTALALGSVALLGACEEDDNPLTEDAEVYVAELTTLNPSVTGNVDGTATFTIEDGVFTAVVEANGLDEITHAQHIHDANACPTAANDANGDGFVDVLEGAPSYGPILLPLDSRLTDLTPGLEGGDFPQGNIITYSQATDFDDLIAALRAFESPNAAFTGLQANEQLNLTTRTVVLHGVVDSLPASVQTVGNLPANVTLPVACGTITQVE